MLGKFLQMSITLLLHYFLSISRKIVIISNDDASEGFEKVIL